MSVYLIRGTNLVGPATKGRWRYVVYRSDSLVPAMKLGSEWGFISIPKLTFLYARMRGLRCTCRVLLPASP